MALQTSGSISINDCSIEAGYGSGSNMSLNNSDLRDLADVLGSGSEISLNDFYGASNIITGTLWTYNPSINAGGNGYYYTTRIRVSDFVSSGFVNGDTLKIRSDTYVQANSYFVAALIVDMPCTILNEGRIVGQGTGGGGSYSTGPTQYVGMSYQHPTGVAAGPAIDVTSTGVTIVNQPGAYIAGGGGGGGVGWTSSSTNAGGGGGAGAGNGGQGSQPIAVGGTASASGGNSGSTNDSGYRGRNISGQTRGGYGGGAGGGGASINSSQGALGGGGGGMELPGLGGSGSDGSQYGGVTTGRGGNADGAGQGIGNGASNTSGGGGGWGATGGTGQGGYAGGLGGPAIKGTARTVTNNGSIYGST